MCSHSPGVSDWCRSNEESETHLESWKCLSIDRIPRDTGRRSERALITSALVYAGFQDDKLTLWDILDPVEAIDHREVDMQDSWC